ncbi:MAG TPA: hypothetical protein GXX39_00190 [Syntrophothermus lipocalidus]|nr:hypothetical protein [Syntrophothermus lipocalidus]
MLAVQTGESGCLAVKRWRAVSSFNQAVADWFFRRYLVVLSLTLVLLICSILSVNTGYVKRLPETVAAAYVRSAFQGRVGSGHFWGTGNSLDFALLQPGDILLGGKPGGAYGHFTHAGLYLGEGQVMEGYVDCGITRQAVEHYHQYDWICILRVKASEQARKKAVEYACQQEGKVFYPGAFKPGERYWNCTKFIWGAYHREGIDLDSGQDLWITPDSIYNSPNVVVVAREGLMP